MSSVDSGNLAGHLLTLGSGLRELADRPIVSSQVTSGLQDTLMVLMEMAPDQSALEHLKAMLEKSPQLLGESYDLLGSAVIQAREIAKTFAVPLDVKRKTLDLPETQDPRNQWAQALKRNLAPWMEWNESSFQMTC